MSGTLKVVTRKKRPELTAEEKLADELVAWAREQGPLLTGPDGLLRQLTKTVLETALRGRGMEAGRAPACRGRPRSALRRGPQHRRQGAAPPNRGRPSRDRAQLGHKHVERLLREAVHLPERTGLQIRLVAHAWVRRIWM
jgi:hypothetical protein